jgi:hypothetical protein
MARNRFGGTDASYVIDSDGHPLPFQQGTAWDAESGGSQLTDLLDTAATPITVVTTDGNGFYEFDGPDLVDGLWLDFGNGRKFAAAFRGYDSRLDALESFDDALGTVVDQDQVDTSVADAVSTHEVAPDSHTLNLVQTLNGELRIHASSTFPDPATLNVGDIIIKTG